jgi:hypothetical protein
MKRWKKNGIKVNTERSGLCVNVWTALNVLRAGASGVLIIFTIQKQDTGVSYYCVLLGSDTT